MIRGSYRKFDNTFTLAFEYQVGGDEGDGDDGRVNSEKVMYLTIYQWVR